MVSEERKEELYDYHCSETNESETQNWRNDLTDEEELLVKEWDTAYDKVRNNLIASIYRQQHINETDSLER